MFTFLGGEDDVEAGGAGEGATPAFAPVVDAADFQGVVVAAAAAAASFPSSPSPAAPSRPPEPPEQRMEDPSQQPCGAAVTLAPPIVVPPRIVDGSGAYPTSPPEGGSRARSSSCKVLSPASFSPLVFVGQWEDSMGHDVTVTQEEPGGYLSVVMTQKGHNDKKFRIRQDRLLQGPYRWGRCLYGQSAPHAQFWICGNGVLDFSRSTSSMLYWYTLQQRESRWKRRDPGSVVAPCCPPATTMLQRPVSPVSIPTFEAAVPFEDDEAYLHRL